MKTNIKKIGIIALLIAIMFILAGCSSGGSSGTPLTEYRVGTEGLVPDFVHNSPPYIVYAEDENFPVTVEIKNRGVYPGEGDGNLEADIYFLGFDNNIITGLDQLDVTFQEEEAKTRFNPEGGITVVNAEAVVSPSFFQEAKIDNYDANIKAILCYPYKTFASIDVCIDPNPNRDSQLDTCTPSIHGAGSQGAPIAISSVESIAQKGKARFLITISNVGGGEVIRHSELSRCTDVELDRTDMDKITVITAELSNGIPLDCTPDGDISLINGKATLICKAEGLDETMPAFETILQMELEYGYKKSISRSVQIQGE